MLVFGVVESFFGGKPEGDDLEDSSFLRRVVGCEGEGCYEW